MKWTCSLFALLLVAAVSAKKSYTGYQVLRTAPLDDVTAPKLAPLLSRPELDFWSNPRRGQPVDVMVPPGHVEEVTQYLTRAGLKPTVHIANVQSTIDAEDAAIAQVRKHEKKNSRAVTFDRFMEYFEILEYLDEIAATYPELVTLMEIGTSTEGQPLRLLKISNGVGKSAVLVDATIHAREWATPPLALKVIYELVENYAQNQALVDMIDWYVLPVVNPDGYVYSWSDDRFWRKTRSVNPGSNCQGTDGNRNFDFHFGEEGSFGPCDEVWPNTAPFSEPETAALAAFITEHVAELKTFMTLHSYGEYLMFPYGHTMDPAPNFDEALSRATEAANALEAVAGTTYTVGQAAVVLYYTYGTSRDWAYGAAGVPFSFTFELPGGGSGGFNPPPSSIIPVVTETWEAIKVLATRAANSA